MDPRDPDKRKDEEWRGEEGKEGDDSSSSASFYTAREASESSSESWRSISPSGGDIDPSSTSSTLLPPPPPTTNEETETETETDINMASSTANSSSSWTSPHAEKKGKLERLQNNAGHIGVLKSPLFPKNLQEYVDHELDWNVARLEKMQLKTEYKKEVQGIKEDINVDHSTEGEVLFKNPALSTTETTPSKVKGKKIAKKGFSTLAEETTIWKPEYTDLPEKRDPTPGASVVTRASWPEQNEFKAEGEHRLVAFGERRLPLPRKDEYSAEAVRAKFMTGTTIQELSQASGEDIAWYERATVEFKGLDKLKSTEKEKNSPMKTWSAVGAITPVKPTRNASGRNTPAKSNQNSPGRGTPKDGNETSPGDNLGLGVSGVHIPGFGTFGGGGFQGMADPQYAEMMGGLWGQYGTQMAAQGISSPPGMASPTPMAIKPQGFAASANRAVSGSSSRAGKRHGKNPSRNSKPSPSPTIQAASPQPDDKAANEDTANNESPKTKATDNKKKKKKGKGVVNKDDPFSEFEDEEKFFREKGFGWVLDD